MGVLPFDGSLGAGHLGLLVAFLAIALGFEFVNGFHDTANAVATVIYTRSLSPRKAVIWSGICNFVGVHLGGTAVAFSIVHLLPVDLLVSVGSGPGMAMVLAILVAAVIWNLGTWYLGLPASSSHTLVGAVLGVGLAHSALQGRSLASGLNWSKVLEVFASLLISPIIGFCGAAVLLILLRRVARNPELYRPPQDDEAPPGWIRAILLGTCTGVSVAHGSNDGQKGIGLIMLILIGLMPARYAFDPSYGAPQAERAIQAAGQLEVLLRKQTILDGDLGTRLPALLEDLRATLSHVSPSRVLDRQDRWQVRSDILRIERELGQIAAHLDRSDPARRPIDEFRTGLRKATDYAPTWVTVAVACALGTGTMVGWKRIVVTVGEKIGKAHLSYGQGAAAEVVAMGTIGLADFFGMPVSTTHVLASGIAGTMTAERLGLQYRTVGAIGLAWVLTLPVSMALSGGLFLTFRNLID